MVDGSCTIVDAMIKNAWSGLKVNPISILHGHSRTHQRIIYTHFLWPNCKKRRSLLNNCLFDSQSWRNKNLLTVNWLKLTAILPQRYITCKTFFSPHHRLCQMSKNVSVIQVTEQWSRFDPTENFLLILFVTTDERWFTSAKRDHKKAGEIVGPAQLELLRKSQNSNPTTQISVL